MHLNDKTMEIVIYVTIWLFMHGSNVRLTTLFLIIGETLTGSCGNVIDDIYAE